MTNDCLTRLCSAPEFSSYCFWSLRIVSINCIIFLKWISPHCCCFFFEKKKRKEKKRSRKKERK